MSDPCSLANLDAYRALHLNWTINIDFSRHQLSCMSHQKYKCLLDGHEHLILDSNKLHIEEIKVDDKNVSFEILTEVKSLGAPLKIVLPIECRVTNASFTVSIKYSTSEHAGAVQWLQPQQTLGGKHPYMFTQCQAIHARSLLPCQDSPGCKFTYKATITVPNQLVALMSAIKVDEHQTGDTMKYVFEQKISIPSYLLAIAVGALEHRRVGPRSNVWSEHSMIEACAYEFAEVEAMLKAGESLMGPYVWGQYDILVLPPSFPYGGMENPCLTFATPTVIAGDRSLTSLLAHEITHSWTGNLVTNRTWEHFWLNEGFTRFLEGKIVGLLHGEADRQFSAIRGWSHLKEAISLFGESNPLTALQPVLKDVDPDDSFSSVPYEKGYAFLYFIESLVGGADVFNTFIRCYIEKHKGKESVVTEDFRTFLLDYFKDKDVVLNEIDWDAWLHKPGMPPVDVLAMYDKSLANACEDLAARWIKASSFGDFKTFKDEEFSSFSTAQKIDFLTKLHQQASLSLDATKALAHVYTLPEYKNSEIKFAFLRLCARCDWKEQYSNVVMFLLEQGRMKFVRPLYREMYKNENSRKLAVTTFKENRHIYHNITSTMVAKDLHLSD